MDATMGQKQWSRRLPDGERARGSASVLNDSLYLSTHSAVYRFARTDGRREVVYRPETGSVSTAPIVVDGKVGVGIDTAEHDRFVLLERDDPEATPPTSETTGTPRNVAALDGTVFVRTTDAVVAIDLREGTKLWTTPAIGGGRPGDVPLVTTDAVVTGTGDGAVVALDPETGSRRWRQSLEAKHAFSPTVSGTTAYVTDSGGRLYALNIETGAVMDRVQAEPEADLSGLATVDIDQSPVVSGSAIHFVAPDGVLVEVQKDEFSNGIERYEMLQRRLSAPPSVVDGALFVDALPTVYGFST